MILGHEAAGTVIETGVPNPNAKATRLGIYNVDPDVTFWATPPVDGCLRTEVVHPAAFTFKLPDHVTFSEGAMVGPFAIGMQVATTARIKSGDTVAAQAKELHFETVFRSANMYGRAIDLIASGEVNLKPLVTRTYPFAESVEAFERAAQGLSTDVKLQITVGDG